MRGHIPPSSQVSDGFAKMGTQERLELLPLKPGSFRELEAAASRLAASAAAAAAHLADSTKDADQPHPDEDLVPSADALSGVMRAAAEAGAKHRNGQFPRARATASRHQVTGA